VHQSVDVGAVVARFGLSAPLRLPLISMARWLMIQQNPCHFYGTVDRFPGIDIKKGRPIHTVVADTDAATGALSTA
jgi:hypothetical protein